MASDAVTRSRSALRTIAAAAGAVAAAAAALVAMAVLAPSAGATTPATTVGPVFGPVPTLSDLRGRAGDWDHVRQVVGWLRYRRPPRHVVYLLGGSATRESITSEAGWSRRLTRRLGKRVDAYVLTSSCQTFVEDARIISALPKGRGVALITVGMSRFNSEHAPASIPRRSIRRKLPGVWWEHHYDTRSPLRLAAKRRLIRQWRSEHLEGFTDRYPDRLAELDTLIQTCLDRGIRPVLLEMPFNMVAARHDLDDVLDTYRQGCTDLAAKYAIPYVDYLDALSLRSSDFYDLWHLLKSGRARWQNRLCRELAYRKLL